MSMSLLPRVALRRAVIARQLPAVAVAARSFHATPRARDDSKLKQISQAIMDIAKMSPEDRKKAVADPKSFDLGMLIKSANPQQLDAIRPVVKAWAALGGKVNPKYAAELVSKCAEMGRGDIAKEFVNKSNDYGFPNLTRADDLTRFEAMVEAKDTSANFESLFSGGEGDEV